MSLLLNVIFSLIVLFSPTESKYIGSIALWVEPSTGQVFYKTEVDGEYLLDECHLMTYIALQGERSCGIDQMIFWSEEIMKYQEND